MVSLTSSSSTINETRFEELWAENIASVRRYVWSFKPQACAVEDIMQETAIALWRKFDAYDPARPFVAWACRFALLQVLKHRQRLVRDRLVFGNNDLHLERAVAGAERESEVSVARYEALVASIEQLEDSERELLQCRYHSQETIQSMAKRRATSVHKLYHSLDSIRESLKIAIDGMMSQEGWERAEFTSSR